MPSAAADVSASASAEDKLTDFRPLELVTTTTPLTTCIAEEVDRR